MQMCNLLKAISAIRQKDQFEVPEPLAEISWQNLVQSDCIWSITNFINGNEKLIKDVFVGENLGEVLEKLVCTTNFTQQLFEQTLKVLEASILFQVPDNLFMYVEEIVEQMMDNFSEENAKEIKRWAEFILSALYHEKSAVQIYQILQSDKIIKYLLKSTQDE